MKENDSRVSEASSGHSGDAETPFQWLKAISMLRIVISYF
jgi:hypothetical protein